jgi:hypothetical protein
MDPDSGLSLSPDIELAVSTLEPGVSVSIEKEGRLIAAIELISPRNKDRPDSRLTYVTRYLAYLHESVHLLLVDVHRRPIGFSFADEIAADLSINQESMPAPLAVSYRVGDPAATGGRFLAIWRRAMTVGSILPTLPLALDMDSMVPVNLELTYNAAAIEAEVE